jgi:16S rRNA C967 or C1407 C5-methylase (RsmB/RsmF family)
MSTRALVANALVQVLFERRSLSAVLPQCLAQVPLTAKGASERALAQEMCYGVLRWQPRLAAILKHLMRKPLKDRDANVHTLLLLGLYQLIYMRTPDHAAVTETVSAAKALNKAWASGLVNAVLRGYVRDAPRIAAEVDCDEAAAFAHPTWLLNAIKTAWPQQWQAIATANNQHPPMTLRVNAQHMDRTAYLQALHAAGIEARTALHTSHGITLAQPVDVERLPGFQDGWVSVQDAAAQLAAALINAPGRTPQCGERSLPASLPPATLVLPCTSQDAQEPPQPGQRSLPASLNPSLRSPAMCMDAQVPWAQDARRAGCPSAASAWMHMSSQERPTLVHPVRRLLDACAAPGGKTAHILESQPGIALTALDNDGQRLNRVRETLQRLGLAEPAHVRQGDGLVQVRQGDAAAPVAWWDGLPFDSILLDAPCSATGVIRRHADIKYLRRAEDITALAEQQARILEALWPLLRPEKEGGGMLLYATCSILPQENQQQMIRFLANHPDAHEQPITAGWGRPVEVGRQVLPGEDAMDGFYYAQLIKR